MSGRLWEAWEHTVRRSREKRAVVNAVDGTTRSFSELDASARAWAQRFLADRAALKNRAVVFALTNGFAWLDVFLGLLQAGAVVVPLDPNEPPAAQRRIGEALRAGYWWDGEQLVALPRPAAYRAANRVELVKLTSGTTGVPRPLAFSGDQMLADAENIMATMQFGASDLNYALIPLGHSYGLGNLTIPLIAFGVPLVFGTSALPGAIGADFKRWTPTVFPGVPALWRAMTDSDLELKSLRLAISAGAPLLPDVARRFAERYDRRVHSFYGSSETGGIAYDRTGDASLDGKVGAPLTGVSVDLVRGGRLRVTSRAVFTHRNRQRTGALGAWLMADRVAQDPTGSLTLLGRRGTIVKLAGRRVDLNEVTALLRRIQGVEDAWVATGDPGANENMLGAAVLAKSQTLTAKDLKEKLSLVTAAWKIPKRWIFLREFPLTDRGKPDVRALKALVFG